jgi:hypothetical protein
MFQRTASISCIVVNNRISCVLTGLTVIQCEEGSSMDGGVDSCEAYSGAVSLDNG